MTFHIGIVMDALSTLHPEKDSTLAMMLECQRRGWILYYMTQQDLFVLEGEVRAKMQRISLQENASTWFTLGESSDQPLSNLNMILMRKDPPFDIDYIYTTQLLDLAEKSGVLVVNKPQTLRDANEKLSTLWFPELTPATLVTCELSRLIQFIEKEKDVIAKPLAGMGGQSVFRIKQHDPNRNVILETLSNNGKQLLMMQTYIPEISQGDKRILLIDGEPVPYALARVPKAHEHRGNIAAGGSTHGLDLSERDKLICQRIAPTLREKGLYFVGIDVIGNYLTEINITSPTGIRQLDKLYQINISGMLMDCLAQKLN